MSPITLTVEVGSDLVLVQSLKELHDKAERFIHETMCMCTASCGTMISDVRSEACIVRSMMVDMRTIAQPL